MADIRISPLERIRGVFSSTQALLENRGACVSTRFGQVAGSKFETHLGRLADSEKTT